MYNGLKLICTFSLGATIGAVVAWKLLEKKYAQIAQEEIDSVKEEYSKNDHVKFIEEMDKVLEEVHDTVSHVNDGLKEEYDNAIYHLGYNTVENEKKGGSDSMYKEQPYVISPSEFAENDYETRSLTYYADGIVTDSDDEPMTEDEVETLVGLESLDHFGEYEEDSVYVRNDNLLCDYEILKDNRNYYDLNLVDDE